MELYARIFILCVLCIARASEVLPEEIAEFREPLSNVEDLSRTHISKTYSDGIDGQSVENPRDKRALGLLLSGLAQVFGYTVTPVQFASLPNSNFNVTRLATMSNSTKAGDVKQQAASSQPVNTTVPRQQETFKFTGVLNFGNNTDIVGHLQRYEQIFHGRGNNKTSQSMPSLQKILEDSETNLQMKPLLAPFFVKIPLPIAPGLLPIPVEDLESHTSPPVSITSDSNENTKTPVRKEQEMIYRSNEDTERYTMEEKDIFDEKDVKKPMEKNNHQLVDEPTLNKQQNDRRNELQCKQEEQIKKLKQLEQDRNRNKATHYDEEERNERYRNHEKANADRNRDYASKHEKEEKRKPAHDDEEDEGSAERQYASQENLRNESSSEEEEQSEGYPNYDDSNKQVQKRPKDFDKYIEEGYNRQLPIGDYFHEGNPEVIRDSYGEVLDNKKLEDDRIAGYVNMFKHPYVQDVYDSQRAHPEDSSREENENETSAEDSYDEHLTRLQKLREEYALPENKYEEYDLSEESEADRENERTLNRTLIKSRRPNLPGRGRGRGGDRTKKPPESNRDDAVRLEDARLQEEADYARYVPLVVPVRYINANDKIQEATMRQFNYKEADKSTISRLGKNNADPMRTVFKENLTPQIGLPERPRQLHEGEHKELQVWPPPFDYAFDNTEPANTVIRPNQNYAPNYYQHVKEIAAQDASDKPSEQPSGYLVVVGNPTHPYQYPQNIYYFSNEAVNSRGQIPHLNAEVTRSRNQGPIYVAQQSANQQIVQTKPNITEYNLNETTNSPDDYHYRSQEIPASVLDRYKYIYGERSSQVKEPFKIEIRSQVPNTENWSNRIYRPQLPSNTADQSPRPVFVRSRNIASSNLNARSELERPRQLRLMRKRQSLQPREHRENDEEATTLQPILKNKPFDDPQSAHDFFGFSKDDYNFGSESSDATKVAEENGKTAEESGVLVAPEPTAYHHDDESLVKFTDEPENNTEKAKVREYRNKVMTVRVSEQRQLKPNGPIHYVDYIRNL